VTMRVFLGIGRVANTPQPWIFERRFSIKVGIRLTENPKT
jgi:hypothetical protein